MDKAKLTGILKKYIYESDSVSNNVCDFFFSDMDKYILGTGRQAAVVLEICRNFKTEIAGIIIEPSTVFMDSCGDRKGYWSELIKGMPVLTVDDLSENNIQIIMTVGCQNYDACEELLIHKGFDRNSIFRCDWNRNTDLRNICYKVYCDEVENYLE